MEKNDNTNSVSKYMGFFNEMRTLRKLLLFIRNLVTKSVSSLVFSLHSVVSRFFCRILRVENNYSRCFLISLFETLAPEKIVNQETDVSSCQEMIRISPAIDVEEMEMAEINDFVVIDVGEKSSSVSPVSSPQMSNFDENGDLICLVSPPCVTAHQNETALTPVSSCSWNQSNDSPIEIIHYA